MNRFFTIGALVALAALALSLPAHADFFSLDGRFQCIGSGAASCGEAQPLAKPRPAPLPAAAQPAAPQQPIAAPLATSAAMAPMTVVALPASAPAVSHNIDPMPGVAARIQARRPSSNDLAWLAQAVRSGDAHAIELLAWCKLNAIGMPRDPVAAYLLYGAASNAALPNARENQRLIYERDLNSDQRQQVLDLANEGVTFAQLLASAR